MPQSDLPPPPPWREKIRSVQGRRSEAEYARETGSRLQPGSGAGPIRKGDIVQAGYLLDHKDARGQKSFTLSKTDFEKLASQAANTPPGMLPGMVILFDDLRLRVLRDSDYLAEKAAYEG